MWHLFVFMTYSHWISFKNKAHAKPRTIRGIGSKISQFFVAAAMLTFLSSANAASKCEVLFEPASGAVHSVEHSLSQSLSNWIEQNQRSPSASSFDREERLEARILEIASRLPLISSSISEKARAILSASPSQVRATQAPYDTVPLIERFAGEEHGKKLWSAKLNRDIFFETKYFDQAERKKFQLTINKDGKLYDSNNQPFDSSAGDLRGLSNSTGRAMIVMDAQGNLYSSNYQEVGKFHHSSFLAGGPIAFAGEVIIEKGIVKKIKDLAGHYNPPRALYAQFLYHLTMSGVDISEIELEGFE